MSHQCCLQSLMASLHRAVSKLQPCGYMLWLSLQIRRFVRYNLGEGIEKKSQDFAAEVAAQTGQ